MNILLINNAHQNNGAWTVGGVEYHRVVKPHTVLKRLYPEFDYIMAPAIVDEMQDVLDQTNLVVFSRLVADFEKIDTVIEKLNGIPFCVDLDDYWHLPKEHILYNHYKGNSVPEATEKSLRLASFVTCTTPYLAEKIKPFNENVYVIENGIDSEDPAWQPNKKESKRLRFGFTQGNTHFEDVLTVSKKVAQSFKDVAFHNKAQVVLTGFNGKSWDKPSIHMYYESMLTDNLKALRLNRDYLRDLKIFDKAEHDAPYRRVWAKDVFEFGTVYNEIDVSVVPLINNEFNNCKSELKMIEAGFKDCGVMINHVKPYTLLATDKNSFDLNKRNFYEWQRYLLNNPNALEDSKAQLKEDVQKYELAKLTDKRKDLYLSYK